MDLKVKLEEAKMIEESLREQLEEKEGMQEEFEKEIVSLRRSLEKENYGRLAKRKNMYSREDNSSSDDDSDSDNDSEKGAFHVRRCTRNQ